jgi:beta-lactamase regulating signal transducer with metallopeptidase domain
VPDPVEKAKDVAGAAAHPVETTKDVAAEADAGRSARTPAIAITGITLVIGVVLALLLVVLFLVYYLV